MSFHKELELIQNYISNFDANEFSSSEDFTAIVAPSEQQMKRAREIKARIGRKHMMTEVFCKKLEEENYTDNDVTITQEEIDALLEACL
jgi:hypothetical protein